MERRLSKTWPVSAVSRACKELALQGMSTVNLTLTRVVCMSAVANLLSPVSGFELVFKVAQQGLLCGQFAQLDVCAEAYAH